MNNDPEYKPTTLSKHIHELKNKGIEPKVIWKIFDRASSYAPVTYGCHLCNKEAYQVIFETQLAELNNRSELFSNFMLKKFKPFIQTQKRRRPVGS